MSGLTHSEAAPPRLSRRGFFKGALLGGGAAVVTAAAASAGNSRPASPNAPQPATGGYRETAAVRQYYRLAREM